MTTFREIAAVFVIAGTASSGAHSAELAVTHEMGAGVKVKSAVAQHMATAARANTGFAWDRAEVADSAQPRSTERAAGFQWGATTSAPTMVSASQRNEITRTSEIAIRENTRWNTQNSASQQGFRWGIKSIADQQGFRWGIKSTGRQQGFRWGIKSNADQQGFRWGIKSSAHYQGFRWGIKSHIATQQN